MPLTKTNGILYWIVTLLSPASGAYVLWIRAQTTRQI